MLARDEVVGEPFALAPELEQREAPQTGVEEVQQEVVEPRRAQMLLHVFVDLFASAEYDGLIDERRPSFVDHGIQVRIRGQQIRIEVVEASSLRKSMRLASRSACI